MTSESAIDPDDQWAEYQGKTDTYEPEDTNPLLSELIPTSELVKDFEGGDQSFQTKVENLCKTYNAFRRVKRDGNCGWRAIAFGYFESLVRLKSLDTIQMECVRLQSLTDTIKSAALDPNMDLELLQDLLDPTFDFFNKIPDWLNLGQARAQQEVLSSFQDSGTSGYITYHLRLLASAEMANNPNDFAPFLGAETLHEYRQRMVSVNEEIDELGIQALYQILLAPADLSLEILDLNRSTHSDEIDRQVRVPDNGGKEAVATLRLLYRPGHYDIIYKQGESVQ